MEKISDYFEGAAAKYLSVVDADKGTSNQHEIGGLPSAGFKGYLGTPGKGDGEEFHFPVTMVYMADDEDPVIYSDEVTWYDSRRKQEARSPEYRLYYKDNIVTELIRPGDLFLIAKKTDGSLLMVFSPADSQCEYELRSLFDLPIQADEFKAAPVKSEILLLPVRLLLEEIGLETKMKLPEEASLLEKMLDMFDHKFPKTSDISAFARTRVEVDPLNDPDQALVDWMEEEERLFRMYENHLVSDLIQTEIIDKGVDVDRFVNLSLSVHNRRKSRMGHAFENHLTEIFKNNSLRFEQGSSTNVTENKAKPDFLFPGFPEYHNPEYPAGRLRMLGAKTTCKDRWRQVLAEADKVSRKHLVTIQPGISKTQLEEMVSKDLQLVVPSPLHISFQPDQRSELESLSDFVAEVKANQ